MKPNVFQKTKLLIVDFVVLWLNFVLGIFNKILFSAQKLPPKNILIYKIGNIGDIVCAIPALIAIRRFYPEAKITLLTSSGKKGALGAKELLNGIWYLDELMVYYAEEINSFNKRNDFIKNLKKQPYDLFIQLPDDLANFKTLLRNMFFARALRIKSAFGFKIRTIQLFKKTQVNYLFNQNETESLLELLKNNGIRAEKAEFDFNISSSQKEKVKNLLEKKWGDKIKSIVVTISPGGKRESNQWSIDRFADVAKYLQDKYNAKIIIVGSQDDILKAEIIKKNLKEENVLILAGKLNLLETTELLKHCSFLIANSTGTIHLAAATGLPTIGLYSIRDVFGRWFPCGPQHKLIYHKFLNCNYNREECIKKSIEMISVDEVKSACDEFLSGEDRHFKNINMKLER